MSLLLLTSSQETGSSLTAASVIGIGGVMSRVQDGQERVIAYYSKVLNKAERNYCVSRRELLAILRTSSRYWPLRLLPQPVGI
jgi:hypothetical protein